MTIERYSRQELITGWNQSLWGNLRALVVGDGKLAQEVSDALVGTGIKSVQIVGNTTLTGEASRDGYLTFEGTSNQPQAVAIAQLLNKINPFVEVDGLSWSPRGKLLERLIENADVVFDTTNDIYAKERVVEIAKKKRKLHVMGATSEHRGAMLICPPLSDPTYVQSLQSLSKFNDFYQQTQGAFPSSIIAGMMVEEIRKKLMPYDELESSSLHDIFWYNLASKSRRSPTDDIHFQKLDLQGKKILIGGAGALGMPVGANFAQYNPERMDVLDYEYPDESNLSRQTLHYDSLGKLKAISLAEKLAKINPNISLSTLIAKLVQNQEQEKEITGEQLSKNNYDLLMRCFDNFKATAVLNSMHQPLIYGGTSFSSANVITYIPGVTSCLNCIRRIDEASKEEIDRDSCDNVPEASIITTSKIAAGLMVGEALLYANGYTSQLINGELIYNLFEPNRMGVLYSENKCTCGENNGRLK